MSESLNKHVSEWRKNVVGATFLGRPIDKMDADFLVAVVGYFIGEKSRLEDELRRARDLAWNVAVKPDPKDLTVRVVGGPHSGRRLPLEGSPRTLDDGGGYSRAIYKFKKVNGEWELHFVQMDDEH